MPKFSVIVFGAIGVGLGYYVVKHWHASGGRVF